MFGRKHSQPDRPVTVAQYRFRFEAEHALQFLRQNQVHAVLWGDDVGGLNPAIGFVEAFEIRVSPEQEGLARELLHDFGMARPGDADGDDPDADDVEPDEEFPGPRWSQ